VKVWKIVFRVKGGGYREGAKRYYTRKTAVEAFRKNPKGKHIDICLVTPKGGKP